MGCCFSDPDPGNVQVSFTLLYACTSCTINLLNTLIYIVTTVHSSFSLVKNRDLLGDRCTADAISVASQSQTLQNYQQPMACLVLYRS